jgi:phage protein D
MALPLSNLPGAGNKLSGGPFRKGLTYKGLYDKDYQGFDMPQASIDIGGQLLEKKNKEIMINDITVDLSCGFEASVAKFRIYNAYNTESGKYRFDEIKNLVILGNSLKISLGYFGNVTPVFVGFVASVDFCREMTGMPYIEVTGMDAKGVMMASAYAAQLKSTSYCDAVEEILTRTAYEKMKSSAIIDDVLVSDTPDKKQKNVNSKESPETIEMVSESDYEFIVKAAKKYNFEFYVDRGTVLFRPRRGLEDTLITLGIGSGLISWRVGYSLTGMVENIEVRSMDPGQGKIISSKGKYSGDLSTGNKAKNLIKGSRRVYIDPTVFSQEQADARRDSLMAEMSYRLGSAEFTCVGIPDIVPGRFLELSVGSPGDNKFYATNVIHEITMEGTYETHVVCEVASVRKGLPGLGSLGLGF